MRQLNVRDETEWFSVSADGRPVQNEVPLRDVIEAIWEYGQRRQFIPGPPKTDRAPDQSTVKQD